MVPATGFAPARPGEDFGFKDRCVYVPPRGLRVNCQDRQATLSSRLCQAKQSWRVGPAQVSGLAPRPCESLKFKETAKGRKQRPRLHGDPEQSKRFIDTAREAGASEDEAVLRENLKRLAQHKPQPKPEKSDH